MKIERTFILKNRKKGENTTPQEYNDYSNTPVGLLSRLCEECNHVPS